VAETLLLTHTDLDGVGCGVLFTGSRPGRGTVELVDNGSIDARVREALDGSPAILVTDHGIDAETADRVDAYMAAGGSFTLLDHHRSSQHLTDHAWATVDETRSATGLLFDHLGEPAAI
jgi:oligoribonuclease NrnB/cAMP/cGMP phosphodiesterase (DHH superfamily)